MCQYQGTYFLGDFCFLRGVVCVLKELAGWELGEKETLLNDICIEVGKQVPPKGRLLSINRVVLSWQII